VLQCGAVCCSVLQCVAVCCSIVQRVAVSYVELQYVAVCCSVMQRVAAYLSAHGKTIQHDQCIADALYLT